MWGMGLFLILFFYILLESSFSCFIYKREDLFLYTNPAFYKPCGFWNHLAFDSFFFLWIIYLNINTLNLYGFFIFTLYILEYYFSSSCIYIYHFQAVRNLSEIYTKVFEYCRYILFYWYSGIHVSADIFILTSQISIQSISGKFYATNFLSSRTTLSFLSLTFYFPEQIWYTVIFLYLPSLILCQLSDFLIF